MLHGSIAQLLSVLFLILLGAGGLIFTKGREGWILINLSGILIAAWISILPHELGHALGARLVGLKIHGIVWGSGPVLARGVFRGIPYRLHAFPLAGVTYTEIRDGAWFRLQRLVVVLAGPMSQIVMLYIAVVLLRDAWQNESLTLAFSPLSSFIAANFLLLTNLFPYINKATGVPSDGKQILALLSPNGMQVYRQCEGRSAMTEAYLHLEARQWIAAKEAIRPSLERHPNDWNLGIMSSLISGQMGMHEEALAKARQLLELESLNPAQEAWTLNSIAWHQIAIGDPSFADEALKNSRTAYEAYPWEPSCISNWGHAQALYGNPDTALALLTDKRMRLNNNSDRAIVECALAHTRARLGMLVEARQGIQRAAELDPCCEFLARTKTFIHSCAKVSEQTA
jgi:hypothetical protein